MTTSQPVSRYRLMTRARGVILFACLATWFPPFLAAAAYAQTPTLEVIDSQDPPWSSIGRVNVAGFNTRSMCTGTLVAPRIVLTAAHCLFSKKTLKPLPVGDVLFIAGLRRDRYAERLEAECYLTGSHFKPTRNPALKDLKEDFGIIVLKSPSRLDPVPELSRDAARDLGEDTLLRSAGYRRSRRFLPTAVNDCRIVANTSGVWITNCPTENGASGGPLLVETAQGPRVAAITSARIDDNHSAVVPVHRWRDLLANAQCDAAPAGD